MSNIKTIIFDLGGVVIDINFDLTIQAFADLFHVSFDEAKKTMELNDFYGLIEHGNISSTEYIKYIKESFGNDIVADEEVIHAWNALLLEIDPQKIDLIKSLRNKYRLLVCSNTSEIHIDGLNAILNNTYGISDLKHLFDEVYYSYEVGLRKPNPSIYDYILKTEGIEPEATLFLDDNLENLKSANSIGIQTLEVPAYDTEAVMQRFSI